MKGVINMVTMPMPMVVGGEKGRETMTDMQFKAMLKMTLTMAETTKDVKEFKKTLAFPDNGYGHAFMFMLARLADTVVSMETVRQVIKDIIMMDMEV
ncbi:MAG: hypothetical protein FWB74_01805 [Defluviitaleaceae bacterium]|nr:hypothetical protein [Defluviitaleaceae bacterium]